MPARPHAAAGIIIVVAQTPLVGGQPRALLENTLGTVTGATLGVIMFFLWDNVVPFEFDTDYYLRLLTAPMVGGADCTGGTRSCGWVIGCVRVCGGGEEKELAMPTGCTACQAPAGPGRLGAPPPLPPPPPKHPHPRTCVHACVAPPWILPRRPTQLDGRKRCAQVGALGVFLGSSIGMDGAGKVVAMTYLLVVVSQGGAGGGQGDAGRCLHVDRRNCCCRLHAHFMHPCKCPLQSRMTYLLGVVSQRGVGVAPEDGDGEDGGRCNIPASLDVLATTNLATCQPSAMQHSTHWIDGCIRAPHPTPPLDTHAHAHTHKHTHIHTYTRVGGRTCEPPVPLSLSLPHPASLPISLLPPLLPLLPL